LDGGGAVAGGRRGAATLAAAAPAVCRVPGCVPGSGPGGRGPACTRLLAPADPFRRAAVRVGAAAAAAARYSGGCDPGPVAFRSLAATAPPRGRRRALAAAAWANKACKAAGCGAGAAAASARRRASAAAARAASCGPSAAGVAKVAARRADRRLRRQRDLRLAPRLRRAGAGGAGGGIGLVGEAASSASASSREERLSVDSTLPLRSTIPPGEGPTEVVATVGGVSLSVWARPAARAAAPAPQGRRVLDKMARARLAACSGGRRRAAASRSLGEAGCVLCQAPLCAQCTFAVREERDSLPPRTRHRLAWHGHTDAHHGAVALATAPRSHALLCRSLVRFSRSIGPTTATAQLGHCCWCVECISATYQVARTYHRVRTSYATPVVPHQQRRSVFGCDGGWGVVSARLPSLGSGHLRRDRPSLPRQGFTLRPAG
jgi:hypothetical protein